ncbi:ABC transporter substrate-binding protein [Solirhodobacter olei]|uniref:ABC transporter substrate-binding protein n=1 Tax=Solirhodobacter olei TaxID=2493082 RepID=UPI000FD956F4|nr:ABC transporter substrate-binding protein [Solirhodobacter olei]
MKNFMLTDRKLHPFALRYAREYREGALSRREFFAAMAGVGVTAAGAIALGGIAPEAARAETAPVKGGTLRIGQVVKPFRDPRTFDGTEMANIARQCNEYLVRWKRDFSFEPMLLAGWEASDDAKALTLKIRPGITWSNGDKFDATDVIFNLTRWCDATVPGNSMASRMATLIDPKTKQAVKGGIEKVDDMTVRLNLPNPDVTLIAGMADYPALIMHRSYDGGSDPMKALAITTGPCKLVSWEPANKASVKRSSRPWWNGSFWLEGAEWNDLGTDPTAMVSAYESGEIDANYETPASMVGMMKEAGAATTDIATASTIVARMQVNTAPYTDEKVRQAVQMAVRNEVLLDIGIDGKGAVAADHHVGPMHPDYADVGPANYDPKKAMTLLKAAGKTGFEHNIVSVATDWQTNTADALANQLRKAGLKVKRTVVPGPVYWTNWTKYPFSLTEWTGRPLGIQVLSLAYRSGAAWNESGFADPQFDKWLDKAQAIPSSKIRQAVMAKLETRLRGAGVIIQPYWRSVFRSNRPNVHGYAAHQAFEQHLDLVWMSA